MLNFQIYIPSPLWMGQGKGRINVFNQPFEHCIFEQAFWDAEKNIRPRGTYSLGWEVELTHKAFPFLLPLPSFLFIHSFWKLMLFSLFWWERGNWRWFQDPLKLWPLPALQLQLFSCPVCTLNSRRTELLSIPKHFSTVSCFQVFVPVIPSASNTPPYFLSS